MQLNHFILKLSGSYWPKDLPSDEHETLARVHIPFAAIDFNILDSNRRMASCMHETLLSLLSRTGERVYFTGDDVNNAHARFVDTGCNLITVDEPFIVAGAASWFTNPKHSLLDLHYFTERVLHPTISPQHALGYVALCLAATFDFPKERPVDEVFDLQEGTNWISGVKGRIITHRVSRGTARDKLFRYSSYPSVKIIHWSRSVDDTLSWFKTPETPFCVHLPVDVNEPATLIFIIKTSKKERFWVFLRVLPPTSDEELPAKGKALVDSCHPNKIFRQVVRD
ncbi:hypothetical protein L218DRAFT_373042 [Marasmius fiardii PR-910]|nr:hypothetical protein L218DRAFT_373042 [Marasmius fiardii PR-910]